MPPAPQLACWLVSIETRRVEAVSAMVRQAVRHAERGVLELAPAEEGLLLGTAVRVGTSILRAGLFM